MSKQDIDKIKQEDIQKAKEQSIRKFYDWYCNTEGYIPFEVFLQEFAPKDH